MDIKKDLTGKSFIRISHGYTADDAYGQHFTVGNFLSIQKFVQNTNLNKVSLYSSPLSYPIRPPSPSGVAFLPLSPVATIPSLDDGCIVSSYFTRAMFNCSNKTRTTKNNKQAVIHPWNTIAPDCIHKASNTRKQIYSEKNISSNKNNINANAYYYY